MALMSRQRLDPDKALEILLYVAGRVPNSYRALKVIYFADKLHLSEHGRLMYGDSYRAMKSGPVPSMAYDIIKQLQGRGRIQVPHAEQACGMDDVYTLKPGREPNLDLISESERTCLDAAIDKYGRLSSSVLKQISHDEAYSSVPINVMMPLEAIVSTLPNARLVLSYLKHG